MKKIFFIILSILCLGVIHAKTITSSPQNSSFQSKAFMTEIDRLMDSTSNITIQNTSVTETFTITGIFIQQLFQVNCTSSLFNQNGFLYGVTWSDDISFTPSASTALGAGYLYSMVMNYMYQAGNNGGPTASTPGSVAGTWCIQLGILQGGPTTYITNSVATNTSPTATLNNVVTWTNNTNPTPIAISCSDATQQCTAAAATIQPFPF